MDNKRNAASVFEQGTRSVDRSAESTGRVRPVPPRNVHVCQLLPFVVTQERNPFFGSPFGNDKRNAAIALEQGTRSVDRSAEITGRVRPVPPRNVHVCRLPDLLVSISPLVSGRRKRHDIGLPVNRPRGQPRELGMPPAPIVDPSTIDTTRVLFDLETIRRTNLQRFEMEQLTAIVYADAQENLIIGYKDVSNDEFWVRGHMPGFPLMPGVMMCETAAQLCSYFCHFVKLVGEDAMIGFGGLEEVRFRGTVRPGDRLVMIAKATKLHRRQTTFETQGFVGTNLVYHGRVIGVTLNTRTSE